MKNRGGGNNRPARLRSMQVDSALTFNNIENQTMRSVKPNKALTPDEFKPEPKPEPSMTETSPQEALSLDDLNPTAPNNKEPQQNKEPQKGVMARHSVGIQQDKSFKNVSKEQDVLNKVKDDHSQILAQYPRLNKSKNPINVTVEAGDQKMNLQFESKNQLKKFIELLNKNKRQVDVRDEKDQVLYEGKSPKKTIDPAFDTVIRDGSETGKIAMAEQLVGDFDAQYEGVNEHRLGIALESDALENTLDSMPDITPESQSAPESIPEPAPKAQEPQHPFMDVLVDMKTFEQTIEPPKPQEESSPAPTNNTKPGMGN